MARPRFRPTYWQNYPPPFYPGASGRYPVPGWGVRPVMAGPARVGVGQDEPPPPPTSPPPPTLPSTTDDWAALSEEMGKMLGKLIAVTVVGSFAAGMGIGYLVGKRKRR